jgi:hypothetical protein
LDQIITDDELKKKLVKKGLENIERFKADVIGKLYAAIYANL